MNLTYTVQNKSFDIVIARNMIDNQNTAIVDILKETSLDTKFPVMVINKHLKELFTNFSAEYIALYVRSVFYLTLHRSPSYGDNIDQAHS